MINKSYQTNHIHTFSLERKKKALRNRKMYLISLLPKEDMKKLRKGFISKNGVDPGAVIRVVDKNGRITHRKPTLKQVKAVAYLGQGYNKSEAARLAGYSPNSGSITKNLDSVLSTPSFVEAITDEMTKRGLSATKLSEKFLEWLDAQTQTVTRSGDVVYNPDYATQIKAWGVIKEVANIKREEERPNLKRKMTIEEFTYGESAPELMKKTTIEEDKPHDETS